MSYHFRTITASDWRDAIARGRAEGRAEGNGILAQIRQAVALNFGAGRNQPSRAAQSGSLGVAPACRLGSENINPAVGSLAGDRSVGDSRATEPKAEAEADGWAHFEDAYLVKKANERGAGACENHGAITHPVAQVTRQRESAAQGAA